MNFTTAPFAILRFMKIRIFLIAATMLLSGCGNSLTNSESLTTPLPVVETTDPATPTPVVETTDIARETACWGYFNSLQPANINQGTQEERREIVKVIFGNALYSSDPAIVSGAKTMLEAIQNEDAAAYEAGSTTFITGCLKAGLWEE